MDKMKVKEVWQQHGLPVIPFVGVKKSAYNDAGFAREKFLEDVFCRFKPPLFIKPSSAGSSLGVHRVETKEEADAAIEDAFNYDTKIILEQGISGRELECAVLGGDDPEVTPPGEIIPNRSFYDYEAKYVDPNGARLCIPAELPDEKAGKIRELVKRAYSTAETYGFARVDLFLEGKTGKIYLNEINTIPGFTNISMFPLLFKHAGYTYTELIDRILDLALEAQTEKRRLQRSYIPPG
jgi:D-alanine-D-alanine ligase